MTLIGLFRLLLCSNRFRPNGSWSDSSQWATSPASTSPRKRSEFCTRRRAVRDVSSKQMRLGGLSVITGLFLVKEDVNMKRPVKRPVLRFQRISFVVPCPLNSQDRSPRRADDAPNADREEEHWKGDRLDGSRQAQNKERNGCLCWLVLREGDKEAKINIVLRQAFLLFHKVL